VQVLRREPASAVRPCHVLVATLE